MQHVLFAGPLSYEGKKQSLKYHLRLRYLPGWISHQNQTDSTILMFPQKTSEAKRAYSENCRVHRYAAVTKNAAMQQLVSFCDAIIFSATALRSLPVFLRFLQRHH